jgi:threonine synthase
VKEGQDINIVVPTGNFGNILAAFYAKNMGIPVGKLICASNENKVLTDFINTGIYDRRRKFSVTNSPSMDILISSNLERFLYEIGGKDSCLIKNLMTELKEKGKYEITEEMKKRLDIFYGDFSDEDDTLKAVKKVYESSEYLIDTHTAVAYKVYEKYKNKTGDNSVTIIASTASPFKFPKSINEVLNIGHENASDFELINLFSDKLNLKLPKGLEGLEEKEICHKVTCKKDEMKKVIENFLGI